MQQLLIRLGSSPSIDITTTLQIKADVLKSVDCSSPSNALISANVEPPTQRLVPQVQATEKDSVGPCLQYEISPITS